MRKKKWAARRMRGIRARQWRQTSGERGGPLLVVKSVEDRRVVVTQGDAAQLHGRRDELVGEGGRQQGDGLRDLVVVELVPTVNKTCR